MRKLLLGCLGIVVVLGLARAVQAETCYADCNPCTPIGCGKQSLWFWGGNLEAGLFVNEYGQKNSYQGGILDPDSGNTDNLLNVRQSDAQLNQFNLYFGKKLDTRFGWDVGGRVDFMYGTDAVFAQSSGLEKDAGRGAWNSGDYYTALSQMYFETGYKKVSVKVGKFYTPMGSNPLVSDQRFFYTLSYAFGMLPVTHTGAIATWDVNKKLSVFGGWVNGEDQFCDTSEDNAFLGGVDYRYGKRLHFRYAVMIGQDDRRPKSVYFNDDLYKNIGDYFVQSFIVGYKPGKRWDYTFEWTLRNEKGDFVNPATGYRITKHDGAYGINNELIYRVNSRWAVGLRAEWEHVYYSTGGPNWRSGVGENMYNFSVGANWTPNDRLIIRPELRYDKYEHWTDYNSARAGGANSKKDQLSGGVSAVVMF